MTTEELIAAQLTVLDRMVAAGWIQQTARKGHDVSIVPTRGGATVLAALHGLFSTEPAFTAAELVALEVLAKTFEPGVGPG